MKMKYFLSSAAIVALSFLAVGCSNDDAVVGTTEGQFTTFVGGMSSAPTTRVQLNENGSVSASTLTELTRTSMDRTDLAKGSSFFWEKDDEIYVKVNGEYKKSSDKVTGEKVANFKFHVDGVLTDNEYPVYYVGTKSTAPSGSDVKVTIASAQTASEFNNTEHFGESGDCGVAKATKQDNGAYSFNLDHKAAYLCLLPYANPLERLTYKIKSVKVKSTNSNIAGDYTLSENGLDNSGGTSQEITLKVGTDGQGLMLANQDVATKHIENSLYMVVAPGTHQLTVEITVDDPVTKKDVTFTKKYASATLEANKVYDVPVALIPATSDYDKLHNGFYNNGSGGVPFDASNPNLAKSPTWAQMLWYSENCMVEYYTPFVQTDVQFDGGVWFKRLDVIAKEAGKDVEALKKVGPNGETTPSGFWYFLNNFWDERPIGRPDKIEDYFFIPFGYNFYTYCPERPDETWMYIGRHSFMMNDNSLQGTGFVDKGIMANYAPEYFQ